jgi:hypothetical protein
LNIHNVPLSRRALQILDEAEQWGVKSDFIFVATIPTASLYPIMLRQFLPKNSTLHGMRSAFRDWAGEETAFEKELCEFAIAHVESKTEQAYRHAKAVERRRPLMQSWSDYLSGIPNDNILVFVN